MPTPTLATLSPCGTTGAPCRTGNLLCVRYREVDGFAPRSRNSYETCRFSEMMKSVTYASQFAKQLFQEGNLTNAVFS